MTKKQAYNSGWIASNIDIPEDTTIIAIGDSHGYIDLLRAVVEKSLSIAPEAILISLGDLIDRGPDSLGCLKYMIGMIASHKEKGIFLPGNHEGMMFACMSGDVNTSLHWIDSCGGKWILPHIAGADNIRTGLNLVLPFIKSQFSIEEYNILTADEFLLQSKIEAKDNLNGKLFKKIGNLVFVHAGIPEYANPDIEEWINQYDAIAQYEDDHPLLIRNEFLYADYSKYNGNIIVHGHTPEYTIIDQYRRIPVGVHELKEHRLGIDGGSYNTGIVTGAIFKRGFYQIVTSERESSL